MNDHQFLHRLKTEIVEFNKLNFVKILYFYLIIYITAIFMLFLWRNNSSSDFMSYVYLLIIFIVLASHSIGLVYVICQVFYGNYNYKKKIKNYNTKFILEKNSTHKIKSEEEFLKNQSQRRNIAFKIRVNPKNNKISQFPRISRNIICEYFYWLFLNKIGSSFTNNVQKIILDLTNMDLSVSWLKKIPYDELIDLSQKLRANLYRAEISKYIYELGRIVQKLKNLNDMDLFINFAKFNRELLKTNTNLNANERGLEVIIPELYKHLKNTFPHDFLLKRAKRKVNSKPKSEKRSIELLYKKFKLSLEIYNGIYEGKCSNLNCNTDFRRLPALDFHHKNPKLKKTTFNDIAFKNYLDLKEELENQNVILLCKNCHFTEDSNVYNKFKDIILKEDLFTDENGTSRTAIDVNRILKMELNKLVTNSAISIKHDSYYNIKIWIKKRSVIEQIFNGGCIKCGEKSLPSLQFHHINPGLKQHSWGDIFRKWNIKKIIYNFIIKEKCVCLCANCHAMLTTSNFEKLVGEIIGYRYEKTIKEEYAHLRESINQYFIKLKKFEENLGAYRFADPLTEMFKKGDNWKKALIYIYYLFKNESINEVDQIILSEKLGTKFRFKANPKLIEKGFITFVGKQGNLKKYVLTEKGKEKAIDIMKSLERNHTIEFNGMIKNI